MPRPKKTIRESQYPIITSMAARGCRQVDIARALGMSFDVWKRNRDEYHQVQEAFDSGRGIEHEALVGALFEMATKKNNAIAAMFLLKCRHGYRAGHVVERTSNVRITVELPGALNAEQYEKVIEHHPEALTHE